MVSNFCKYLVDAHINPGHLTISRRSPDYIGEALAPQWDNLGKLYTKYQQGGRLSTADMRQFQTTRKLLQLANIVRETQTQQYLFERYCFYGCHCIPGYPVHDSTAGKGAPQDGIDTTCSKLRQCYYCAKTRVATNRGRFLWGFSYDEQKPIPWEKFSRVWDPKSIPSKSLYIS